MAGRKKTPELGYLAAALLLPMPPLFSRAAILMTRVPRAGSGLAHSGGNGEGMGKGQHQGSSGRASKRASLAEVRTTCLGLRFVLPFLLPFPLVRKEGKEDLCSASGAHAQLHTGGRKGSSSPATGDNKTWAASFFFFSSFLAVLGLELRVYPEGLP
jgi:hypothetical protein